MGCQPSGSINSSRISRGTAKMNDTYSDTATYNNPNEREHVMCQEVAHTFGLDHKYRGRHFTEHLHGLFLERGRERG